MENEKSKHGAYARINVQFSVTTMKFYNCLTGTCVEKCVLNNMSTIILLSNNINDILNCIIDYIRIEYS